MIKKVFTKGQSQWLYEEPHESYDDLFNGKTWAKGVSNISECEFALGISPLSAYFIPWKDNSLMRREPRELDEQETNVISQKWQYAIEFEAGILYICQEMNPDSEYMLQKICDSYESPNQVSLTFRHEKETTETLVKPAEKTEEVEEVATTPRQFLINWLQSSECNFKSLDDPDLMPVFPILIVNVFNAAEGFWSLSELDILSTNMEKYQQAIKEQNS